MDAQYPTQGERAQMRARLLAFIAPRVPCGKAHEKALCEAADAQISYEKEIAAAFSGQVPPPGVSQVSIGNFSMRLDGAARTGRLTRETMAPAAYAALFGAGLLYRGVGR